MGRVKPTTYGAVLITGAFFILASLYSIVNPIFEAPDEPEHYRYIHHIVTRRALPVLDVTHAPPGSESYQHPLYYIIAAVPTALILPPDDVYDLPRNPHASLGQPAAFANKNVLFHSEADPFPYRRTVLAAHLIRFLSVLMGTATIWLTYLTAREILPQRPWLIWGALAIAAFNPQFIYISRAINNDNAVVLTSTLTLLLLVRVVRRGMSPKTLIALGVALGLALLTKTTALALLPLTAFVLSISAFRERKLPRLLGWGCVLALLIAIIAGWWYWRNWQLYGDGLATGLARAIFHAPVHPPGITQLLTQFLGVEPSFWAVFGSMNITVPEWFYILVRGITRVGVVGLVVLAVKETRRRARQVYHLQLLTLAAWIVLNITALLRMIGIVGGGLQGRLLFPALPAIAILLFLGIAQLLPRRGEQFAAIALGLVMLCSAAVFPFLYIKPVYARPPLLSAEDIASIPHRLEATFAGRIRLLGYLLPENGANEAQEIVPGQPLSLTLVWQSLATLDTNYSVFIHVLDENDLIVAQADSAPGRGNYPTQFWQAGDTIADEYAIPIPRTLFAPSQLHVAVGLYDVISGARLSAVTPGAQTEVDQLRFGDISLARPESAHGGIPVWGNFDNQAALVGYDIDVRRAKPGDNVQLTLYWQALKTIRTDYTVFTHILGTDHTIAGQHDSTPRNGATPTSTWQPNAIMLDTHTLVIDPHAPPGVYIVVVGLYHAETGKRLPLLDDQLQYRDTRVLLSKLRITEGN